MDHLIHARKPDQGLINKKKKRICHLLDFAILADHRVKIKESEKTDKYLDLAWEMKKAVKHEGDGDTNCSWYTWNDLEETGGIRNQWEN